MFQIFTNVTLQVDPSTWTRIQKDQNFSGSFTEVEKTFLKLAGMDRIPAKHETYESNLYTSARFQQSSHRPVEPVFVDAFIMDYIKIKCVQELDRIGQTGVLVDIDGKQVTFREQDPNQGTVRAQLVRERFITFYQKVATRLQSRTFDLGITQQIRQDFPELLVTDRGKNTVTLTGSYLSLDRFERLSKSLSKKINHTVQHSSQSSSPSPQNKPSDPEETCCICLEPMVKSQRATLKKCKHSFCKDCLKQAFEIKPVCPTCGMIYGALKGTQPEGGKMKITYEDDYLPGYKQYKTIVIHYVIPDGIQGVRKGKIIPFTNSLS